MVKALLSYQPFGKTLLALEHSLQVDDPVIFGLELVQKKGELDIHQTFTAKHPDELSAFIKTTPQISLVITNDHVLFKEVPHFNTDAEIVAESFPNLNLNDFYYQILRTADKSFIAVCRKQYVETLVETYQKATIKITNIALGGLKMAALAGYAEGEQLHSYNTEVSFNNGEVIKITPQNDTTRQQYSIEGLTFPSTHTLPLAVALDNILKPDNISGNIEERNTELQKNYKESQFFKSTLQIGIGFLLLALLINFFIFNAKYKKWQGLQEELQVYTTQKEHITRKQADVHAKESLVQSILTTGFSKSSYYIDTIVQEQPSTVLLTSLAYQPLAKPIRKNKAIDLMKGVLSITGVSTDKADFTAWLRTMEGFLFVDAVTITQYGLDKKNTTGFELILNIKSDGTAN